ncbi:MAG TPA: alpha/beta hydrolase [Candidatus Binatia bacterium]|nr:alpha/beta hydrolase [Candidatus Binatia bacterium]
MNDQADSRKLLVDVPVQGGTLRVAQWGSSGPVVLCVHGITASHVEFEFLADELAGSCRLIAPDLRGRGRSNGVSGPWGMAAHATDLVAVLDHLGIARADVLLGHSMGGFVGAVAAARAPERFGGVLMLDGGVPLFNVSFIAWLPFSDWLVERLVSKIIGPSLARLDMTFESREAYRAFWRRHPALAKDWSPHLEAYADYDLDGDAPALRPSTRKDALLRDVRTQLVENLVPQSLKQIRVPVRFLRAERGVFDDAPLYPEKKLARPARGIPRFSSALVPDVNHYTLMMSARGAKAVAAEVQSLL